MIEALAGVTMPQIPLMTPTKVTICPVDPVYRRDDARGMVGDDAVVMEFSQPKALCSRSGTARWSPI